MKVRFNRKVIDTILFCNILVLLFFIIIPRAIFFIRPFTATTSTQTIHVKHIKQKNVVVLFDTFQQRQRRKGPFERTSNTNHSKRLSPFKTTTKVRKHFLTDSVKRLQNAAQIVRKTANYHTTNKDHMAYLKQKESVNKSKKLQSKIQNALCDDPTPGSKNIISYSLFGEKALHIGRFIKDVSEEALSIDPYKDFTLRIYVDKSFPEKNRDEYREKYSNVRFCDVTRIPVYGDISNAIGTVWRFIPMADTSIDVFCSRDLDSPLLQRGGDAVKEFLNSNATLHLMRDYQYHGIPIMGAMWCFHPPKVNVSFVAKMMRDMLKQAKMTKDTKFDQFLLERFVWPAFKNLSLQHDAYFCTDYEGALPFPTQRRDFFVGCVRDCNTQSKNICPVECRPKEHKNWLFC